MLASICSFTVFFLLLFLAERRRLILLRMKENEWDCEMCFFRGVWACVCGILKVHLQWKKERNGRVIYSAPFFLPSACRVYYYGCAQCELLSTYVTLTTAIVKRPHYGLPLLGLYTTTLLPPTISTSYSAFAHQNPHTTIERLVQLVVLPSVSHSIPDAHTLKSTEEKLNPAASSVQPQLLADAG